ncbi:hypothetical protein F2Q70_00003237 [Brassica cretica]|uniref:Uncharacterized protein n=1 Tax=Brassica cretica TaxID=69181 RepID=A0A8S9J0R3_BRACR|nr:hypothetical protein F2Q70_00003237 [Brassica cretica]
MPNSTRSNKETQLLFSPDPASLERSIRKEARSSSIDNNTCSSLDFVQPPSIQTLVPSTDTCSLPSTKDTHLPSTDIVHPTSIDTPSQTSIDTEPRDMVATLILVRDNNGDMHDQDGHLRNAARQRIDAQGAAIPKNSHGNRAKHPHPPNPDNVKIARRDDTPIDRETDADIDRQPPAPIDRRAPITYRVQMPKIDVARLSALRPKPKPLENPPETVRTPSDDGEDPMEEDRVPTGRTLRRRKEKVAKHLKRGANEKEKENFRKRVFRIPLDKPFEEAYYTHRLWMFFRETREKEEDIKRMFCEAREKMRMRITLKKKSDPGQFAIPCTVEPSLELFTFVDCSQWNSGGIVRDLEVHIDNALVPVDFHVLDIKLELFSTTQERFLVNSGSSVQLANQPVMSNTHRS